MRIWPNYTTARSFNGSPGALVRKFCHLMDHWACDLIAPVTQLAGATHLLTQSLTTGKLLILPKLDILISTASEIVNNMTLYGVLQVNPQMNENPRFVRQFKWDCNCFLAFRRKKKRIAGARRFEDVCSTD